MKLPLFWLHDYCRPDLDTRALADRLSLTGTVVDRIETHGVAAVDRFVVGRVLSAERHPDADRLSVCVVDVGEGEPATIVCGAPNVAAGQTVAVARPGAVMPDGAELGQAKLRGVTSDGMILAEDELAIGPDHAGIIVLDEDGLRPGEPLAEVLPIATDVLELEITPNRPDCLAVYGVAREVHAATGAPLAPPPWAEDPGTSGPVEGVEVIVEGPDVCPRFTARVFDDVKIAPSPLWLKARLTAAGQRPINNVVDITNYVMLVTGQPLHAFDLDRVAGGRLVVRRARDGEQVETLDGQVRTLDSEMVLIEDAEGPTSIAGVMGGARSEVAPDTTRVLMEVANWVGPNIKRTSERLGLRSEASSRYEKQLQPEQTTDAQAVATRLMIDLCGATLRPGTIDVGPPPAPLPTIRLREARVARILGQPIRRERQAEILRALEFGVDDAEDGLDVTVPYFRRGDVYREIDLIEEVARIDGLDNLPATLPARGEAFGRLTPHQRRRRRAQNALADRGFFEVTGWSFVDPAVADRLRLAPDDPGRNPVVLENPLSEEQSRLRTLLLPSLLDNARRNVARGTSELRLFELGAVYFATSTSEKLAMEREKLGAVMLGPARPAGWRSREQPDADVFAAKAVLGAVLDTLRVPWSVDAADDIPFLHPGRTAIVSADGVEVGWVGELHPLVAGAWDLDGGAAFEVDLQAVSERAVEVPTYRDVTSYPEVREDIAVVVPASVPAADVLAVARRAGAPLLASAEVFDVYRGAQVGEG
ncbi:MAG: phenylalanyl-tRNA synthetase subunit beta, partial [Solirubrobacterales bacterium]|nr:phenylalanyl-tRNA synthetase subunit beta [Solirubrobacterales bacterium]